MTLLKLLFALALALAPVWQDEPPPDPETQRQEILTLETETARAIQLHNGTFFRRVYSENFSGTLSHGQHVDRAQFIDAVQTPDFAYSSFSASDIEVHLFRETAISSCLWTSRAAYNGRPVYTQMRVLHVFINGAMGWRVVASQATPMPPSTFHPL